MKIIFCIIALSLTFQLSYGQACGIYRIKYVGEIKPESIKVDKVKLPTIMFLHGLEKENSKMGFTEVMPKDNMINIELVSHLTSDLFENPESLLNYYKKVRKSIPIIFMISNNGKVKTIKSQIAWEKVSVSRIDDSGFGYLFELNLNEIIVE